ncbi:hypothetical protein G443_001171 [Actinoalloteichus cyanogriseus DSM 43889]|uniref:Uncharacterized protein n=1 Tax=Actinoalloteichus caeruleus DSM 43889 TaxID=1120930 RepID=A0ABT1JFI2_ACTCY|nr:hypothetical protein [Actinoalloteichus caeruleus DSM 43889]
MIPDPSPSQVRTLSILALSLPVAGCLAVAAGGVAWGLSAGLEPERQVPFMLGLVAISAVNGFLSTARLLNAWVGRRTDS